MRTGQNMTWGGEGGAGPPNTDGWTRNAARATEGAFGHLSSAPFPPPQIVLVQHCWSMELLHDCTAGGKDTEAGEAFAVWVQGRV